MYINSKKQEPRVGDKVHVTDYSYSYSHGFHKGEVKSIHGAGHHEQDKPVFEVIGVDQRVYSRSCDGTYPQTDLAITDSNGGVWFVCSSLCRKARTEKETLVEEAKKLEHQARELRRRVELLGETND